MRSVSSAHCWSWEGHLLGEHQQAKKSIGRDNPERSMGIQIPERLGSPRRDRFGAGSLQHTKLMSNPGPQETDRLETGQPQQCVDPSPSPIEPMPLIYIARRKPGLWNTLWQEGTQKLVGEEVFRHRPRLVRKRIKVRASYPKISNVFGTAALTPPPL